jgi:methionyl-tRNA synthetase
MADNKQPTGTTTGDAAAAPASNQPLNTETPAAPAAPPSAWPMDQRISIDDFMKIDLRVAKVITAERVPNSKKLMKLEIDLGSEQRTLVAGFPRRTRPRPSSAATWPSWQI